MREVSSTEFSAAFSVLKKRLWQMCLPVLLTILRAMPGHQQLFINLLKLRKDFHIPLELSSRKVLQRKSLFPPVYSIDIIQIIYEWVIVLIVLQWYRMPSDP